MGNVVDHLYRFVTICGAKITELVNPTITTSQLWIHFRSGCTKIALFNTRDAQRFAFTQTSSLCVKKNVCCIFFYVFCVMGMCHTEGKCCYVAFLDNKAIQTSEKYVIKFNEQSCCCVAFNPSVGSN